MRTVTCPKCKHEFEPDKVFWIAFHETGRTCLLNTHEKVSKYVEMGWEVRLFQKNEGAIEKLAEQEAQQALAKIRGEG